MRDELIDEIPEGYLSLPDAAEVFLRAPKTIERYWKRSLQGPIKIRRALVRVQSRRPHPVYCLEDLRRYTRFLAGEAAKKYGDRLASEPAEQMLPSEVIQGSVAGEAPRSEIREAESLRQSLQTLENRLRWLTIEICTFGQRLAEIEATARAISDSRRQEA